MTTREFKKDFAVFILSHGRPDKIYTLKSLADAGYTGKIYIVIDDEDKRGGEYVEKYGEMVTVFSKREMAKKFDEADNFNDRRAIVYARNYCYDLAGKLGVRYFLQLDDDYTIFAYKFNSSLEFGEKRILSADRVFISFLNFLKNSGCDLVAMAQGGDFLGGGKGLFGKKIALRRKCMNTFFCDAQKRVWFNGRINEDVNTYVLEGLRGSKMFTVNLASITQKTTQKNKGGMTDIYLDNGTYIKSFYTVMMAPSCTFIAMMGETKRRLHHRISWQNAVPLIVGEEYRKAVINP